MSFAKSFVSGVAAFTLMATAASAAVIPSDVTIQEDGTGDYLLFPAYYAAGNWTTKIKVANTNETAAVIAKVVIRQYSDSKEVLDFPIYLTPGDVWEATIYQEGDVIKIKSTDDSTIIGGVVASATSPFVAPLVGTAANTWKGYVEVAGVVQYATTAGPIPKLEFYNAVRTGNAFRDGTVVTTPTVAGGATWTLVAGDVESTTMTGQQAIVATSDSVEGRRNMMLNALAFNGIATDNLTHDIIAQETNLANIVHPTSDNAANTLLGMEAATATDKFYVLYSGDGTTINDARVHMTAPFKKYGTRVANVFTNGQYTYDATKDTTPATYPLTAYYYEYEPTFYDMSENHKKCVGGDLSGNTTSCKVKVYNEVEAIDHTSWSLAYPTGGMIIYDLTGATTNYVSVVPTTFYAEKINGTFLNNHLYNPVLRPAGN